MTLAAHLTESLKPVRLLDHPFYVAWSMGKLTEDDLRFYAGQYGHVVRAFPDMLATSLPLFGNPAHRRALVANLADEEGVHGPSHPELWWQFGEAVGASRSEVENAPPLPETAEALATLRALATESPHRAMATFYAVESQAPDVSAEKLRGLSEYYGITDPRGTAYFRVHAELDREHSSEEAEILADLAATPEAVKEAEAAAVEAAKALRRVLDGVVRARNIAC